MPQGILHLLSYNYSESQSTIRGVSVLERLTTASITSLAWVFIPAHIEIVGFGTLIWKGY
jgi:hypothetical protein